MLQKDNKVLRKASPYSAAITREQFLFYEVRTTARLLCEGLDKQEVIDRIVGENLFQLPTEKSTRVIAQGCLRRLDALGDESLIRLLATGPGQTAKQVCLYAMMRHSRLVWDFMVDVIGEKYKNFDLSFGKIDLNVFFLNLQQQDEWVATWSDSTIKKLKQVLLKTLVENEYLASTRSDRLNPVLISSDLENAIRAAGQQAALPAFNCLT